MTGQSELPYIVREAAYDLRKLRAKNMVLKSDRSGRCSVPSDALRTITAVAHLGVGPCHSSAVFARAESGSTANT